MVRKADLVDGLTEKDIDAELRALGFEPTEIVVKGRVFIAALADNIRLRRENKALRAKVRR